ncbi:unnamed protein product [Pseudo-nitzschia multistriata]|uniref:5'-Nucleotidase C-terminal domain-containing protein n=1 Tax=Pseudo-nitzschia multistriata TaxID=183589 RepID=A0A448ZEX8_9STRA|nr:unnamed protein product [Pseudo-nitzschia multistriata]
MTTREIDLERQLLKSSFGSNNKNQSKLVDILDDTTRSYYSTGTTTTANSSSPHSIQSKSTSSSLGKTRKKTPKPVSKDDRSVLTAASRSSRLTANTGNSSSRSIAPNRSDPSRLPATTSSKSKRLSFDGSVYPSPSAHPDIQLRSAKGTRSATNGNSKNTHSLPSASSELPVESAPSNPKKHQHKDSTKRNQKIRNSKTMSSNYGKVDPENRIEHSIEVPHDEGEAQDTSSSGPSKKLIWLSVICFVVVVTAVAVPCALLLGGSGGNTNFPNLSKAGNGDIVALLSESICNEGIPHSGTCTPERTAEENLGGELCNLLAKAMINTTVPGDIAIVNAGVCEKDLLAPELKAGDIKKAIAGEKLVAVDISGVDLSNLVTEAATASFGPSGNSKAYPYASGIRYDIEANLPPSERVSNIEVNRGLSNDVWEPIDLRKFYTVITTESLAKGDMGYDSFAKVIDDWKDPLNIKTGDAFYYYAMNNGEDPSWSVLPSSEYSTQYFLGENDEAKLGVVPQRICHALMPGQPTSPSCTAADVANGGGVCNMVAWAVYDQNLSVDIVMIKGKTCKNDIEDGLLVESKIDSALSGDNTMHTFEVVGSGVVKYLDELVSEAIDDGIEGSYPYGAGVRFDVNKNLTPKVTNVEVLSPSGNWEPISLNKNYMVAQPTGTGSADSQLMKKTMKENIISYADEWNTMYPPPAAKASTQSFA